MKLFPHALYVRLHNNLTRERINIQPSFPKNMDAMMPVNYSSIRPGL